MRQFYFLLVLTPFVSFSQDMQWQWANLIESNNTGLDHLIINDNLGNLYSFATFSGETATVGAIELQNTNPATNDSYFVKYNSDGELQWVKQIAGNGTDQIFSADTDSEGNIFIAGVYLWDGITFGNQYYPGTGMFLAKYDTDGELQWVRTGLHAYVYDMEVAANGDLYIGGNFNESFNFNGIIIDGEINSSHIFLARMDPEGDMVWFKNVTGPAMASTNNLLTSLATDTEGNAYITGWFRTQPTNFDDIAVDNNYWATLYLAKYNTAGNVEWLKTTGNNNCAADPRGLSVDSDSNVYLSGSYCGDIQFGEYTLEAESGTKSFIVKYGEDGTEQWARTSTGGYSRIMSSDLDSNGYLYVSGTYLPPFDLGDGISLDTVDSAMFITRYSPQGTPEWIIGTGRQDVNSKISISLPEDDVIYAAGYMSWDELALGDIDLQNASDSYRVFLAKIAVEELSKGAMDKPAALIYPNPVKDIINVQSEDMVTGLALFDINGRKMAANHGNSSINVAALAKGMYFLIVTTGVGTFAVKVVKE